MMMRKLLLVLALAFAPIAHSAITFYGAAVNPTSGGSLSDNPSPTAVSTSGFAPSTGALLILYGEARDGTTAIAMSNAGGQTWTCNSTNTTGPVARMCYATFNGTWSADPSMSHNTGGSAWGMYLLAFNPSVAGSTWASEVAYATTASSQGSPFDYSVASQTPSAASTVTIASWFSNQDAATWTLQTGGWTQTSPVYYTSILGSGLTASFAYKIQTSAAATGAVVNRQSAGNPTVTMVQTFREIAPACPGGKQCVTLTSINDGSGGTDPSWCYKFNLTQTPDIAIGDVARVDLVTTPSSFPITQLPDCSLSYAFADESRQYVLYDVFDTSVGSDMTGGPGKIWFNNGTPAFAPPSDFMVLETGVAMTPQNLCDLASDPEGDDLTLTVDPAISNGTMAIGGTRNCVLSGTPATEVEAGTTYTFTATDIAGASATLTRTIYYFDTVTLPNCVGLGAFDCQSLLTNTNAGLTLNTITFVCGTAANAGTIGTQDPAAATEVDPFSEVDLTVYKRCASGSGALRMRARGAPRIEPR